MTLELHDTVSKKERDTALQRRSESRETELTDGNAERVRRAGQGDEDAFRWIFERYGTPVLHFLLSMVGNKDLAEDLTQETFVRAYQKIRQLRDPGKLSTWLFGIARNVAREAYRQRKRDAVLEPLEYVENAAGLSDAGPHAAIEREEFREMLRHALWEMDEDRRLVFTLRVFHDCTYEEISEITGFSMSKLKSDLHRARQELRIRLKPSLETPYEL